MYGSIIEDNQQFIDESCTIQLQLFQLFEFTRQILTISSELTIFLYSLAILT